MTIKQIEALTGMTRANIRYYESEGLIHPRRNPENGYRDYSQEDGEALLKIRLLRCLDISIEELKAIQSGTLPMEAALRKSLEVQQQKQVQIQRAGELTRQLLSAGTAYENLDAAQYLQQLESGPQPVESQAVSSHPWRRYFARSLDLLLYRSIAMLLFWEYYYSTLLTLVGTFVLMVTVEPVWLHFFGTTPGKAILGLEVRDLEDKRLSYGAGVERTWTVLWEGMALTLPLVNYYFLLKSYRICEAGEPLPWEWDSEVSCKDAGLWRWIPWVLVYGAILAATVWGALKMEGVL